MRYLYKQDWIQLANVNIQSIIRVELAYFLFNKSYILYLNEYYQLYFTKFTDRVEYVYKRCKISKKDNWELCYVDLEVLISIFWEQRYGPVFWDFSASCVEKSTYLNSHLTCL
jgi:hypothetical protein